MNNSNNNLSDQQFDLICKEVIDNIFKTHRDINSNLEIEDISLQDFARCAALCASKFLNLIDSSWNKV